MLCVCCNGTYLITINKLFELRKNHKGYFNQLMNPFVNGRYYRHQSS